MTVTKNKNTKYLLVILMAVVFCLNINKVNADQYTNYYGIAMTTEEYTTLLNLGFSDDEIYYMDKETFDDNKELDATLLAQSTKYYKVISPTYGASYTVELSEEEYNNDSKISLLSELRTSYYTENSSISANGSKYRYKNVVVWTTIPDTKSYDIIAIGYINSVRLSGNVYFKHTHFDPNGEMITSTSHYGSKEQTTGVSRVYKIPDDMHGMSIALYFDVEKNVTDTLDRITFCGDHAHAGSKVTRAQAAEHGINSTGIVFTSTILNKYDAIPCADTTAYITW